MLDRPDEHKAAYEALLEISEIKVEDRQWFDKRDNLVQVINPHVLVRPRKFFPFFSEDEITIKALQALAEAPVGQPMSMNSFYTKVGVVVTSYEGELRERYFERIAEAVGLPEESQRPFHQPRQWIRPRNVFPIPYYKRTLAGYTDTFEQKERYNLKDLREALGEIYTVIRRYLQQYPLH